MSRNLTIALFVIITFSACTKDGLDGRNTLVNFKNEPIGINCSSGGYKVISGLDLNENGVLDDTEIQNTEYICNGDDGANGNNSLLNIVEEPIGDNCSSGGYKVTSGLDLNNNGLLEDSEIQNTEYICNGDDGTNGYSSLVKVEEEIMGDNCSSGGYKISYGLDLNHNGLLNDNEIQKTEYICNGDNGANGYSSLVNVEDEPIGDNCSSGGYKISSGLDLNSNGILDESEIQHIEYVCNGDNGGSDKEIRFDLTAFLGQSDSNPSISDVKIRDFNINNYQDIDSIVFVSYKITTATGCCGSPDVVSELRVELYDLTNNTEILNSEIISDDLGEGEVAYSKNLFNSFPQEKIDVGLKLTYEPGTFSYAQNLYLILYRK